MNRLILISLLFFCLTTSHSQSFEPDLPFDLYGLEIEFKEKIMTDKCDCCCSVRKPKGKCELFRILVKNVLFHRDSAVYSDSSQIIEVKYLVLGVDQATIKLNKTYTVFGYNSCSKAILLANQIFYTQPDSIPNYGASAHITGLNKCKKYTFFQKLLLRLGINREKVHKKAKNIPPEESKFVQALRRLD